MLRPGIDTQHHSTKDPSNLPILPLLSFWHGFKVELAGTPIAEVMACSEDNLSQSELLCAKLGMF